MDMDKRFITKAMMLEMTETPLQCAVSMGELVLVLSSMVAMICQTPDAQRLMVQNIANILFTLAQEASQGIDRELRRGSEEDAGTEAKLGDLGAANDALKRFMGGHNGQV